MIRGIGIDIEPISRMTTMMSRYDREGLLLVFTPKELDSAYQAEMPAQYLALCFSAKEAIGKALGTGLATSDWCDIEGELRGGVLSLTLSGAILGHSLSMGVQCWMASWSTWEDQVLVTVVLQ